MPNILGFISQFTLNYILNVTTEINSGRPLNLFQGLNNIEIPKQVRDDDMRIIGRALARQKIGINYLNYIQGFMYF